MGAKPELCIEEGEQGWTLSVSSTLVIVDVISVYFLIQQNNRQIVKNCA